MKQTISAIIGCIPVLIVIDARCECQKDNFFAEAELKTDKILKYRSRVRTHGPELNLIYFDSLALFDGNECFF